MSQLQIVRQEHSQIMPPTIAKLVQLVVASALHLPAARPVLLIFFSIIFNACFLAQIQPIKAGLLVLIVGQIAWAV